MTPTQHWTVGNRTYWLGTTLLLHFRKNSKTLYRHPLLPAPIGLIAPGNKAHPSPEGVRHAG